MEILRLLLRFEYLVKPFLKKKIVGKCLEAKERKGIKFGIWNFESKL